MIRIFTSDLKRNITKTICLTLGLAIGFLLVAKVYFEQTYDAFLPDSERIYMVTESAVHNGEYMEYDGTPDAIAPESGGIPHRWNRLPGRWDCVENRPYDLMTADNLRFPEWLLPIVAGLMCLRPT